jgi:hypothetical protein
MLEKAEDNRAIAVRKGLGTEEKIHFKTKLVMGPRRFERLTSRLSAVRILSIPNNIEMDSNLAKLRALKRVFKYSLIGLFHI